MRAARGTLVIDDLADLNEAAQRLLLATLEDGVYRYIDKEATINDEIDRLRLAATSALVSRRDVIIVASVSCIFGLGSPADYAERVLALATGQAVDRRQLLHEDVPTLEAFLRSLGRHA